MSRGISYFPLFFLMLIFSLAVFFGSSLIYVLLRMIGLDPESSAFAALAASVQYGSFAGMGVGAAGILFYVLRFAWHWTRLVKTAEREFRRAEEERAEERAERRGGKTPEQVEYVDYKEERGG